jgi:cytoskeletal protein RodZ
MTFEDLDSNEYGDEYSDDFSDMEVNDTPPPEEASNRTFLIVAGVLAGLIIVSIVCMALYALVYVPQQREREATQVAEVNAQNTQVALAAAQTEEASRFTNTPTMTSIPPTETTTPTSVVAVPTEEAGSPTPNSRTATVAALLTQAAEAQLTITPSPSALPDTGFMDEVVVPGVGNLALVIGVPGLIILSLVLVGVIILARRLRSSD